MIRAFDCETRPANGGPREASLQPWRVKQGLAEISYAAMVSDNGDRWTYPRQCSCITEWSDKGFIEGDTYVAWNAVFDLAWLVASGCEGLEKIQFEDAMLLWKHVDSTQSTYSLKAAVKIFLSNWDFCDGYIELKQREIDNNFETDETEEYNYLDAQVTLWIYQILRPLLTPEQEIAYMFEQSALLTIAKSWVIGTPLDGSYSDELNARLSGDMLELERKLGFDGKFLRSKKMLDIVYGEDEWCCPVRIRTDTGNPALNKDAMAAGIKDHPGMALLAAWKKIDSIASKYTKSVSEILEYTGDGKMYACPRMFGTYTGRFTYSGKTTIKHTHHFKKGGTAIRKDSFTCALAVHQIPRRKDVKRLCVAPPGKKIVEFDASGQESRIMAVKSMDPSLIKMFNQGMDTHCFLGSKIIGISYEDFMLEFKSGNELYTGPQGYRMLGKIGNLACQYRIGKAKLQMKALTDYGVALSMNDTWEVISKFKEAYPGVVEYWKKAPIEARLQGYAESLDGRRVYITDWVIRDGWDASQKAINTPVQGTGAGQKLLAIWLISVLFPEFELFLDLHDGLYYFVDDNSETIDKCLACKKMLNNIDYVYYWGVEMPIPLPWDCSIGSNRGDMVDIT